MSQWQFQTSQSSNFQPYLCQKKKFFRQVSKVLARYLSCILNYTVSSISGTFRCKCGKTFEEGSNQLRKHRRDIHEIRKCGICDKAFVGYQRLHAHRVKAHGHEPKKIRKGHRRNTWWTTRSWKIRTFQGFKSKRVQYPFTVRAHTIWSTLSVCSKECTFSYILVTLTTEIWTKPNTAREIPKLSKNITLTFQDWREKLFFRRFVGVPDSSVFGHKFWDIKLSFAPVVVHVPEREGS